MLGPVLLVSVILLLSTWLLWRKRRFSLFRNLDIPGPPPNLLFGNALQLYTEGPIQCHKKWIKMYGRVFGYYLGMKPILMVADPELLKLIQIKDFNDFIDRPDLVSGRFKQTPSIIGTKGSRWKEVRSVLTPSFTTGKMKLMSSTMNEAITTFINVIRKHAEMAEPFNVAPIFQSLTMDVIARAAFGLNTDVQTNPKSSLVSVGRAFFSGNFASLAVMIGICFPEIQHLTAILRQHQQKQLTGGREPTSYMAEMCKKVIEARKQDPTKRQPDLLQLLIDTEYQPTNLKSINAEQLTAGEDNDQGITQVDQGSAEKKLPKSSKHLSQGEIIANSIAMLLAGFETTSTALSFITAMLARHPRIQEKVRQEVMEVIQQEKSLDYGTVNKMQYLDQVMCEIFRLYPPVYLFVNRIATVDVQYGNLRIPRGLAVQAPVYLLHHDPEFWEEPETFDPDRFSPERKSEITPLTWQPFGGGPRNCIGMRFAQMEIKMALARLLSEFRLESTYSSKDQIPLQVAPAIIRPNGGVSITAVPLTSERPTKLN